MATIHTYYRSFHIFFRDDTNNYRVTHDRQPELADEHLHHHSMTAAKHYVDVCCDVIYGFVMDPHKSLMLAPFYRTGFRSDGPLPAGLALVLTDRPFTTPGLCNHVFCHVNQRNMQGGSLWQYCGNRTSPGTTRCLQHSC